MKSVSKIIGVSSRSIFDLTVPLLRLFTLNKSFPWHWETVSEDQFNQRYQNSDSYRKHIEIRGEYGANAVFSPAIPAEKGYRIAYAMLVDTKIYKDNRFKPGTVNICSLLVSGKTCIFLPSNAWVLGLDPDGNPLSLNQERICEICDPRLKEKVMEKEFVYL